MTQASARRITAEHAARIVYRTAHPTTAQVQRIEDKLKSGALVGNCDGRRWTTSPDGIAEYLALRSLHKQSLPAAVSPALQRRAPELRQVYREILKDYFLTVLLQRGTRRHDAMFRRAVLVGQLTVVLVMAGLCYSAYRLALMAPPEHAVISRFLENETGRFRIVRWHAGQPEVDGDRAVRLQYAYFSPGGKQIVTDRVFVVRGNEVADVYTSD